jgi:hypothetical protein
LILEEEMAPIVKFISKFETPLTKSIKQSIYLGKCYWFYVIYHMVLSTTVLGWLADNVSVDPNMHINEKQGAVKLYVEAVGAFHQHRVFLTVGVIDMLHVLEGLSYFTRTGHSLTEEEEGKFKSAEDKEDEDADHEDAKDDFFDDKFDFSRNYGETIGVFTSLCYYQVMHPTILLCGAIYYQYKFYVDKYQITNQYTKPKIQYGGRARTTTTYILYAMVVGQLGNVIYYVLLVEDLVVGCLMGIGLLASCGVFVVHQLKPKFIGATLLQSSEAKADDAKFEIGLYEPPRPEDMSVRLQLHPTAAGVFGRPVHASGKPQSQGLAAQVVQPPTPLPRPVQHVVPSPRPGFGGQAPPRTIDNPMMLAESNML